jgi:hypothetical protein
MRSGRGHGWGGNVDEVTAMTGVVTEGVKLAGPHGTMKITTSDGKVWNITLAPPSRHRGSRSCWPVGVEPRQRYDTLTGRNKCTVFYVSHLMSGTGVPGSSSVEGRWLRSRRPFASPLIDNRPLDRLRRCSVSEAAPHVGGPRRLNQRVVSPARGRRGLISDLRGPGHVVQSPTRRTTKCQASTAALGRLRVRRHLIDRRRPQFDPRIGQTQRCAQGRDPHRRQQGSARRHLSVVQPKRSTKADTPRRRA